ncbi:SubName: Full=Related to RRS1-regulator of ribosome biogenesis {ECO:0000313/EMBL:CCA69080.1} [Serendipita indica DSM 11827]|nr:SubName: Full=Related to RRS1-regulator of ribosome biogenesis {ECO:0000313/EMBL:CCA69080.1} [Serendipita indica DSM 11827]
MDVTGLLASTSTGRSTVVEKDVPLVVDAGLLAVFDSNDIDEDSNPEEYLQSTARDGVQALINALFTLPIQKTEDGPLARLPPIEMLLPRAKPLPKPKPLTKWEQFARAKGIQKKVRDKRIWDEQKQEWVARWGRNGKNKEIEEQWITEVPDNAPDDYDPIKEARDVRKARVAKNEKQRQANIARAQGGPSKDERKAELRNTALQTKISTASMGKFDKKLEGDPKLRGIKRKFEPNEGDVQAEKSNALALLAKLERAGPTSKKTKTDGEGGDDVLNVRKAVRYATKGKGATSLAAKASKGGGKKGRAAETRNPTLRKSLAREISFAGGVGWFLVTESSIPDQNTFANEEGDDPSRVGGPQNPIYEGLDSLSTSISFRDGNSGHSRELQRAAARLSNDKSQRSLTVVFEQIQSMCDQYSLPRSVSDTAKMLYRRTEEEKLLRGKQPDAIVAACLFIACRQAAVPRTFKEIVELTNVPKKQIGQCYKALERAFNLAPGATAANPSGHSSGGAGDGNVGTSGPSGAQKGDAPLPGGAGSTNSTSPEDLMARYCNYLDLPPALQAYCADVSGRARSRDIASGRSPVSIASGIIYFTAMLFGYSVSLKEIGATAGVSEGTIKLVYRLLWADREALVNEKWIEEGKVKLDNLPSAETKGAVVDKEGKSPKDK